MSPPSAAPPQVGFLSVLQDAGGHVGGYLVTNLWGRPVEFRLSSAVQPNKVQQILYGHTLPGYVCGELIGKTLVEKAGAPVRMVFTDTASALELRRCVEFPVLWVSPLNDPLAAALTARGLMVRPAEGERGPVVAHADFPGDVEAGRAIWETLGPGLDAAEPFGRVREAVAEARKMGVMARAA